MQILNPFDLNAVFTETAADSEPNRSVSAVESRDVAITRIAIASAMGRTIFFMPRRSR